MKLSRNQLRLIIAEAIRKPIFSKVEPEEIDAIRQEARGRNTEIDREYILDLITELLIEHGKIKDTSRESTFSYLRYLTNPLSSI